MFFRPKRYTIPTAIAVAAGAVVLIGLLGLRGGQAKAQSVMSAPACQCSAQTSIPSMSSSVVYCLCGGMSCVISEHTGQGRNSNLMQCVR